jgi:hypothetical protein
MILNTLNNFQTTDQQMTPSENRRRKKSKQRRHDAVFNIGPNTPTNNDTHTSPTDDHSDIQLPPTIVKQRNETEMETNDIESNSSRA